MTDSTRMRWVDVAKGVCMALVVLRHSALWLEGEFNSSGVSTFWWEFSEFLSPIRMPLFFLISGYLAAGAIRRPLRDSRARTFGFWYLYAFWTGLFLLRLWLPVPGLNETTPSFGFFLLSLILPTSYWYLWALAFFFLFAWTAQRVLGDRSRWLLLPLFALAFAAPVIDSICVPLIPDPLDALKLGSMALNLVWFFAGVHLKQTWNLLMARSTWWAALALTASYAAAYALAELGGVRGALTPALALIALVACALAIPHIPLDNVTARWLERVGQGTLPVYIFHIFAISALSAVVKITGLSRWISENIQLAGAVLPPVVMFVLVSASMFLGRLILRSPARWVLSPDWLKTSARPPKSGSRGVV